MDTHDGANIADFSAYQVERRIRAADRETSDAAIAEMKRTTDNLIAAYLSRDEFRILRCSEEADAARLRLMQITGIEVRP